MLSLQQRGGLCHGDLIQRIGMVGHKVPFKRRTHLVSEDPVAIELLLRVEARMKIGGRLRNRADSNSLGKAPIYRPAKVVNRDSVCKRDCRYLANCVHTGVRTTGSYDIDVPAFNPANNLLEDTLHCRQSRLYLPAVELRAVVSNLESKPSHTVAAAQVGREPGFVTRRPCRHKGQSLGL